MGISRYRQESEEGQKNKGTPETLETPQSEAIDATTEPQPIADNDLPTEISQEIAAVADDTPVPEAFTEPAVVPEDDWSSLTTSKKGKKAKKSKKLRWLTRQLRPSLCLVIRRPRRQRPMLMCLL